MARINTPALRFAHHWLLVLSVACAPAHSAVPAPAFVDSALTAAALGLSPYGGRRAQLAVDLEAPIAQVTLSTDGGPPLIEYSPADLFRAETYGTAATIFVLAHELGHQIMYDAGWRQSGPRGELLADQWGGCALATLGLDPTPAVQYTLETFRESATHPDGVDRVFALVTGYDACR